MTVKFIETTFVEIPVGEHFKFKASAKGVYTKHRVKGGPGIGNEYAIQEVKGVVRHPKSTRKVYLLKHDDQLTHHSPAIAEAKAGQYSTIHTMNISEQIDDFIRTEGKGNARDAVNVALAKIEILEFALKKGEQLANAQLLENLVSAYDARDIPAFNQLMNQAREIAANHQPKTQFTQ